MSDPIWKEEERRSREEKDADPDSLSLSKKKDAWLKQLEFFSMSLQEFLLRQSLLSIKKMQRLEVFFKLVRLSSHSEFFNSFLSLTPSSSPLQ